MSPTDPGLLARLESFALDEPGVVLPFTARLVRENGWTNAFAGRVVREYKRFVYLSATAGHPVTPSEEVDQAWHLHMVYTRSYWDRLCGEILGRPLHHGPTEGGAREGAKFRDWYARTLDSYRAQFAADPPADIWPPVARRFSAAGRLQWVDRARFWIIRKPCRLPRFPRPLTSAVMLATAGTSAAVAGCSSRDLPLSPFDWTGGLFLILYGVLFVLTIIWASRIRRRRTRDFERPDSIPELTDPVDIAFLAGGGRRAIQTALTRLVDDRALTCTGQRDTLRFTATGLVPQPLSRVEEAILLAAERAGAAGAPLTTLLTCAGEPLRDIESRLSISGLKPSAAERQKAGCAVMGPFILLIAVGVVKTLIGLTRDRPVGYLVLLMILAFIIGIVMARQGSRLTTAGRTLLDTLRQRRHGQVNPGTPAPAGMGPDLPMAVALTGVAAMAAIPELQPLAEDFARRHRSSDTGSRANEGSAPGCSTSGCSTSGCSSSHSTDSSTSSDSGGSSGCGSSGCGGCGGGGGD